MSKWVMVVLSLFGLWFLGGCAALTQGSSIQTGMETVMKEVVAPAVAKAGEELSARTAQLSGQMSAINPGYKVQGHAIFGTGVVYDLTVTAVGISANVAAGAQGDQGPDLDGPDKPDSPGGG